MTKNEILRKQIIYRSTHRGSKEMDLLLGNFVEKYIDCFDEFDLKYLNEIMGMEDEVIYRWYFKKKKIEPMSNNKVTKMLKDFKL